MRHLLISLLLVAAASACRTDRPDTPDGEMARDAGERTDTAGASAASDASAESKIENAMRAAPEAIARAATIMDWPAQPGGKPRQLRAGTNGWTCFPSTPQSAGVVGEDPMCLDKVFLEWADAWTAKRKPKLQGVGLGYMLRGDKGASATDPYATEATPDNNWVRSGPHVMMVTSDSKSLETLPGDPKGGGPWVMWKGTPYAHVMMPVEE